MLRHVAVGIDEVELGEHEIAEHAPDEVDEGRVFSQEVD
jgi:hypothetical protein